MNETPTRWTTHTAFLASHQVPLFCVHLRSSAFHDSLALSCLCLFWCVAMIKLSVSPWCSVQFSIMEPVVLFWVQFITHHPAYGFTIWQKINAIHFSFIDQRSVISDVNNFLKKTFDSKLLPSRRPKIYYIRCQVVFQSLPKWIHFLLKRISFSWCRLFQSKLNKRIWL